MSELVDSPASRRSDIVVVGGGGAFRLGMVLRQALLRLNELGEDTEDTELDAIEMGTMVAGNGGASVEAAEVVEVPDGDA